MANKLVVIVFFLLIVLPAALISFGFRQKASGLEKRSKMPEINSISEFFDQTDKIDAFNKLSFPLRKILLSAQLSTRHYLNSSPTNSLYSGKDGWLFTDMENIVGLRVGSYSLSQNKIKNWNRILRSTSLYFEDQNIKFYVTVAPNKHSIECENLPDFLYPYFTESTIPFYIENVVAEVPYLDLFTPLRAYALETEEPIYFERGTHWNAHGGYKAYEIIAQAIKEDLPTVIIPSKNEIDLEVAAYSDQGLARQLDFRLTPTGPPTMDIDLPCPPLVDTTLLEVPKFGGRFDSQLFGTSNSGPRLVIIGDSFTQHNLKYYLCSFSEVLFVHHRNGRWDKKSVDSFGADVVLFEFVERYVRRNFTNIFEPAKKKK